MTDPNPIDSNIKLQFSKLRYITSSCGEVKEMDRNKSFTICRLTDEKRQKREKIKHNSVGIFN